MAKQKKIKLISDSTILITWLIAETALQKAGIEPNKNLIDRFVSKANYHFNNSVGFRKAILSEANDGCAGRDNLYMYFEHWIKARFWVKYPEMPEEYLPYLEDTPYNRPNKQVVMK